MSIPQSGGGPIESFDQLALLLEQANNPKTDWRIGTEHEKFGHCKDTLDPLPYEGERSVLSILQGFVDRFDWAPFEENGSLIGLTKDGATGSREAGGALERAGATLETMRETCD